MNSGREQFDIAIVGGGLAGISMLHALRTYPGKVALIDRQDLSRADEFSPPLRAIALSDSSHRIFSALGVWDEIAPCACPVRRIHVSEKNAFGATKIDARNEHLDSLAYVVTNIELLRALYRSYASSSARATLFASHSLASVQRKSNGIDISLQSEGREKQLSARLLILADGGGSSTKLGFMQRSIDYRQTAHVIAVETERAYDGTVYERFTERGLFAVLPLNGANRRAVVWVMRNDESKIVANLSNDELAGVLGEELGRYNGAITVGDTHFSYPLELRYVSHPAQDRVVVLGDAAHKLHPIAGQSFNLGLRDVAFLAEHITNGEYADMPDMLAAYCRTRVKDTRRVVRFTDGLSRLVMCRLRSMSVLRGAGLAVFNAVPPLRRFVVRRSLGLSPPYSRLACGVPLS